MASETDIAMPIAVSMRVYFSTYHLWAAKEFCISAKNIEENHVGKALFDIKHRAYVTNSIFSSVAFLEAAINEIFKDASDEYLSYIHKLSDSKIQLIADYWNKTEEKNKFPSTLDKYQEILRFCECSTFDKSDSLFQNAQLVTKLRNNLVHYKPESLSVTDCHRLSKQLTGKFPKNKLMNESGNPFFPDQCLGYGCAKWAIKAVEDFANNFFKLIDITPNYQSVHFKSEIY